MIRLSGSCRGRGPAQHQTAEMAAICRLGVGDWRGTRSEAKAMRGLQEGRDLTGPVPAGPAQARGNAGAAYPSSPPRRLSVRAWWDLVRLRENPQGPAHGS